MQTGRVGLLHAHEVIPWPELSAVRMPRQLQVIARCCRRCGAARLMSEQYLDAGSRRTHDRCGRIATLPGIEMMRAVVGDAGNDERCLAMRDDHVLVHENREP